MCPLSRLFLLSCFVLAGCASLGADRIPSLRLDHAHLFGATALAYNASGDLLATGGFHGEVRIWHMPDGTGLMTLPGNRESVRGIAWVDNNNIVVATEDGTLTSWDLREKKITRRVIGPPLTALLRIPGSQNFVVAHNKGLLRTYNYPTLAQVIERQFDAAIRAVAVSDNGDAVAVATDDRQVRLFDSRLQGDKTLSPAQRSVISLRFSPDAKQLAAGTWFKLLLWDLASGRESVRDTEHFGAIISIDYTPDSKRMVSLGRISDSSLRLTDIATGRVLSRMTPLPLCGWMVQISPDGRYAAAGSESGDVLVFDLSRPVPNQILEARQRSDNTESTFH